MTPPQFSVTVYSLLVQFWTRNGVDSWPRVGQRHDAESETWPGACCLKMDLPYIPHPLRPAAVGVDWLYCVWAKCDLSSESGFVSTWDLACFLSSFMRAEPRGSLCFLCPHRTTGEAWQKRLFFSLRVSWRRGLFWPPSLPAPGQPVSISAWIPPVGLVPQNDRKQQQ